MDLLDIQVPTHVAITVGDPVVAHLVPLGGTALGTPLEGTSAGNLPQQVVEQVQAVFEAGRHLDRFHQRQCGGLVGHHR
ncbi:hypothetical protein D3C80_2043790 [compost metagenome]